MAPNPKMKIIVTENILLEGDHTEKDSVRSVDADLGRLLIGCKRAEEATEEALSALDKRKKLAAANAKPAATK